MFSYFNYILNGTAWESPADRDSVVSLIVGVGVRVVLLPEHVDGGWSICFFCSM